MKISLLQCVLMGIMAGVGYAYPSDAQELLQKRITLSFKDSHLKQVLRSIENQAGVVFSYQQGVFSANEKVDADFKNEPLQTVLSEVLTPRNIRFQVVREKQIILSRNEQQGFRNILDPNNLSPAPTDIAITGNVTDENGAGLPGVSILVKGTQRGTTTDQNGDYRLSVENTSATLVFSFVGYVSQEVVPGNRTQINVSLKPDLKALEEVVVVGYGTVKKSDLTGSVSSLKEKDFNPGANASVDQMMLGRSAGVQINQTSSEPGGGVSIRIRGANSLNAGSEPLYVIDGLPIDNGSLLSASSGGYRHQQQPPQPAELHQSQ